MTQIPFYVLIGIALACQGRAGEIAAKSPHVWEKVEITLPSQRHFDNPYTDVQVWVDLKGPDFEKRCYGFWDGGSTFRVRILATVPGRWTWRSGASIADPGLRDLRGEFTAIAWTEAELEENICRRGMIRPSGNGHAFEHADGTPFFLLGDTWWATPTFRFRWYEDDAPRPLGPTAGFKDYVRYRRQQEYNCVAMIAAFPNWANDGKPARWRTQDGMVVRSAWPQAGTESAKEMTNEAGRRAFHFPGPVSGLEKYIPDLARIDPEYFQSLDRKVDYLNAQGMVPFIEVARRDIGQAWKRYYPWPDSYARYIEYVWTRYQANICLFSPIHLDTPAESIATEDWNAAANLVIEKFGHPPFDSLAGTNSNPSSLRNWGHTDRARWLGFHQIGNRRTHDVYECLTEIFRQSPPVPGINGEPYYDGMEDAEPGSDKAARYCRSAMYGSVLCGGLGGHIYGAGGWKGGLWSGEVEAASEYPIWKVIQWPSADQMRHLRTFVLSEGRRYQDLVPSTELLSPNRSGDAKSLDGWAYCAATRERDLVLLYFERNCPQATVSGLSAGRDYEAHWYDPRTGRWLAPAASQPITAAADGTIRLPPFPNGKARSEADWALKLRVVIARQLDPAGKMHIPIGIPNSLDSLKTFVETEGSFSPGIGTYGICYSVYDRDERALAAPTLSGVVCTQGLAEGRYPIPWSQWSAGGLVVRSEVCEVTRESPRGEIFVVGSRARVTNTGDHVKNVAVYVALRPLGPAGFAVGSLAVSTEGDALLADGHPAVVARPRPSAAGVLAEDAIGQWAARGNLPDGRRAESESGDCSGALRFDLSIPAGGTETIRLVCPVLAGRRAVRHQWTARPGNFIDSAVPQSGADGIDQPDPGLDYYRALKVDDLFAEARRFWERIYSRVRIQLPDPRWTNGLYAMLAHASLCLNENAPDVAVLNYTVFNRDGMYVANMMQKGGFPELSEAVIDYFLAHPFNGRPFPEADNPGQILWCIGQHWRLTRDNAWLERIYPSACKVAELIEYCRTTPEPHWVDLDGLSFGAAVPEGRRRVLKPGACDGFHPEYTEAFDLAGLRVMAELAEAVGRADQSEHWRRLAARLTVEYDRRFGKNLGEGYGKYSVLWPCCLYPFTHGPAWGEFQAIGKQNLASWRYFAPATAHQGLLAGNREAGYGTVDLHLDHPQMREWFAFDEGGKSGSGGWQYLRTTWTHSKEQPDQNRAVAMPHGWAIAEVWLLMRDCLAFEDDERLVLLGGIDPAWLERAGGFAIENLPTYYGALDPALSSCHC